MLKAIIFDCDGVIADTEPIHMAALQQVLSEEGIALTRQRYFDEFLALDDRACFTKALAGLEEPITTDRLNGLIARKGAVVETAMLSSLRLLPGVSDFVRVASERYPLAVASGALRSEIEMVLQVGGLRDCFRVIVSAEDVPRCKPDPAPFLKALDLLNLSESNPIKTGECLVIEDSIYGLEAARRAAMRSVAVSNSYPRHQLSDAGHVVDSLAAFPLEAAERLFFT